jgi:adenylyl-sulfate kinase
MVPNEYGLVVWLTGLSGAGKTTIAQSLQCSLTAQERQAYLLDGDVLRTGLCRDLGYSLADREENIRRAGAVAAMMAEAGVICLVALISPLRKNRELVRAQFPAGRFLEVFVNAPLEVCERRDPKGLYARARRNELADFTGISSPYEPPAAPEVEVRTDLQTIAECVRPILALVDRALDQKPANFTRRPKFHLQNTL